MTYGEISEDTAREICKTVKKNCKECPLRRNSKIKGHEESLLFCNYVLRKLYEGEFVNESAKQYNEEELNILFKEEIHHEEELKEFMKQHDLH